MNNKFKRIVVGLIGFNLGAIFGGVILMFLFVAFEDIFQTGRWIIIVEGGHGVKLFGIIYYGVFGIIGCRISLKRISRRCRQGSVKDS